MEKKKTWRLILNKSNIEGWDYKKNKFKKNLKNQSQPILIFETYDPYHKPMTNTTKRKILKNK